MAKIAMHCATCSGRLHIENPAGKIMWNAGLSPYHFAAGRSTVPLMTVCGRPLDEFDSYLGVWGLALSDDDLGHAFLRGLEPCGQCWEGVLEPQAALAAENAYLRARILQLEDALREFEEGT